MKTDRGRWRGWTNHTNTHLASRPRVEELRNQLLQVRVVGIHAIERVLHVRERSVGVIVDAALEVHHFRGHRPNEVEEHVGGSGVVRAVKEGAGVLRVVDVAGHELHALPEVVESLLVESADRLGQVPVVLRVGEVELLGRVVGESPGEDGVCGERVGGKEEAGERSRREKGRIR